MAASIATKAQRRAERMSAAVRDFLAEGDSNAALTEAVRRLRSEAAKVRRQRPGDGPLTDADLAASIVFIAAQLFDSRPPRPPGCPRMPRPADMLAIFDAGLERAAAAAEEGQRNA
jgi:hypothetical protein